MNENLTKMAKANRLAKLKEELAREEIENKAIEDTAYLVMAAMFVTLRTEYLFTNEDLSFFKEATLALINEKNNEQCTTQDIINWAEELTGIDVRETMK